MQEQALWGTVGHLQGTGTPGPALLAPILVLE